MLHSDTKVNTKAVAKMLKHVASNWAGEGGEAQGRMQEMVSCNNNLIDQVSFLNCAMYSFLQYESFN